MINEGLKRFIGSTARRDTLESELVRSGVLSFANKVYVNKYVEFLRISAETTK